MCDKNVFVFLEPLMLHKASEHASNLGLKSKKLRHKFFGGSPKIVDVHATYFMPHPQIKMYLKSGCFWPKSESSFDWL